MKTTDLKPLFWKEWHENIRWALLALLALSLGLAYTVLRQPSSQTLSQIWADANLVLTLVAPLIGLALGLLQILPELRRDQWAFLVHRPVPRTTLFFGKALPGVCLYLLATIPPLLGFAFWASFPSHIPAPFDFRFTLAGWAAILSGLPFYFAGLLVALRPARWYGSRALPILAAVAGLWAANWFGEFWQAALACLFAAAVLLLAAWGSFVTGGDYKEQTKPARFALGLALYPTVVAVGFGVLMLLAGGYNLFAKPTGSGGEWWRTEYKIDTQGRIFETAEHGLDSSHQDNKTVTVTDQAGHTVDPQVWDTLSRQHKLLDTTYLYVRPGAENYIQSYRQTERYVSSLASDYDEGMSQSWYYDSRSRQIVQYTVHLLGSSFTTITYLGPKGFSTNSSQAGQFPDGMPSRDYFASLNLLRFSHSLYWYDTAHPAIGLLQSASNAVGILGTATSDEVYSRAYIPDSDTGHPTAYYVAADDQVTAYTRKNREATPESTRRLFQTRLTYDGSTAVQVAMMPDFSRFFFWYQAGKATGKDHVVTFASDGHILNTETFPPSGLPWVPPPGKAVPFRQCLPALVLPPAFAAGIAVYADVGHAMKNETAESWWRGFGNGALLFPSLFFSGLSGLISATLAWRISLRCGDNRRGQIAWAVGVFWLGLYGVLLLVALRAWPARVPCPNCGRLRVVDRELCEHCGAAFARPKRDGTEIFEGEREPTPT